MKFSFLLIILMPMLLCGQTRNDWGAVSQRLDIKPFAGKKFRIEAAVRVELIDPAAEAEIWVRVDRAGGRTGFFYNMADKPIRTKDWKVYSIEGKMNKDAEYLAFGGIYAKKGIFYFDDFRLFVETSTDKFEEVSIPNGNFEADTLKNWIYPRGNKAFSISLNTESPYAGKQSVKVNGSQFNKEPTFGSNDSTGKYAAVNGIKIYYEEYGIGEPLLLLHGNSESIRAFRQQIPELSKYYRVITIDTRGQGKSTEDGKTYTYDLFAEDMNALLDYLKIDSANVVGWSDGGNTGLVMAMKFPGKVKKLVTMGANVFIDHTVVDKWVFKELNKELKELANDTTYLTRNRTRLIQLLLTEPKHTFIELRAIKCPVLVLAGEKDVIKEEHTRKIAENITGSSLIIAPKQTHYYPSENPEAFNKTVLDFLKK